MKEGHTFALTSLLLQELKPLTSPSLVLQYVDILGKDGIDQVGVWPP
jgi:hypothetical protein